MNRRQLLAWPAGTALAAGAATVSTLAGCVSVKVGNEPSAHVQLALRDGASATVPPRERPLVPALLIQPQPGFASADTLSIAFSRKAHEFAYYQFASWTERPVLALPRLLQQRLQARGVAAAVGLVGDPMRANWLLALAVESLHHDASSEPGSGKLVLNAELYDRRSHSRLAQRRFEASTPLARADSAAAAQALSASVGQAFDALQAWLETELGRVAASAATS